MIRGKIVGNASSHGYADPHGALFIGELRSV